jgi:hypothetical protein
MVEAGVAAGIALFTAIISVHNRLYTKINEVDSRVDKVELRVKKLRRICLMTSTTLSHKSCLIGLNPVKPLQLI